MLVGINPKEFSQAEAALLEINVANLPDQEMVRPVLELRRLVVSAAHLVELIAQGEHDGSRDPDEGRESLTNIHDRALTQTTIIEATVNRMRDKVK